MIVDILRASVSGSARLIPVEALRRNCDGSRMPVVRPELLTTEGAQLAAEVCPTEALVLQQQSGRLRLRLDYGKCIGCGRCVLAAPEAIVTARSFSRAGVCREELVRSWDVQERQESDAASSPSNLAAEIPSLLGRALNVRQLDAGSCNGCEAEIAALTNPFYDLERFGIHFVASPKHADMLLVTGPVTRNMAEAVRNTYEAVPDPKVVVAVGACGVSGGLFRNSPAVIGPVDAVIPVDGYIPGCPPTPAMLVAGILEVLRRHIPTFQR
jgi:Ni,Fe-hydrogenase III small subunit/ferredoxin